MKGKIQESRLRCCRNSKTEDCHVKCPLYLSDFNRKVVIYILHDSPFICSQVVCLQTAVTGSP